MTTAVSARTARRPSRGPAAGLVLHAGLLTALAATTGLGVAGWLAGGAYAVVLSAALAVGLRRTGTAVLGPANAVTLGRAVLTGGVTALVAHGLAAPAAAAPTALLTVLVAVALALDGVDGQVARRTGSASALGARFDMEVDAFLILVLSVHLGGVFGWWTVAIGAYRYVFLAASWALPWLAAPLPPRFSRKVVAALQGVVLVTAAARVLPDGVALVALAVALAALTWSFGRDVAWLWGSARTRPAGVQALPWPVPRPRAVAVDPRTRRPAPVG